MDKFLGQNINDPEAKKNFLLDNADEVEEKTYLKTYDTEDLQKRKDQLADVSIKINDIEADIKAYKDAKKVILKPLKEEKNGILADIKAKGELVTEQCYKFTDREEGMTGFYNSEGMLIESRPATRDELQKNLFTLNCAVNQ